MSRRHGSQSKTQYLRNKERQQGKDQVFEDKADKQEKVGPTPKETCGSCTHNIEEEDEDIFCDGLCGKWYHIACARVTEEENKIIGKSTNNINWYCVLCADKVEEMIHEDWGQWKKKQEEMLSTIGDLTRQLGDMKDKDIANMDKRIKTLEEYDIKAIKEKIENGATAGSQESEETKEKIRNLGIEIEANKKATATKCNSEEVNGIMKAGLNKENREMQSTVRKTVAEEVSKAREKNIIIYRAEEGTSNLKEENIKHDKAIVRKLIQHCKGTMEEDTAIDKIIRLGRKEEGKIRPLLVAFKELETKKGLFRNLKELGQEATPEELKNLSVSHDMTTQEREENKKLVAEARAKDQENPTLRHIVRGAPWNREIVAIRRS